MSACILAGALPVGLAGAAGRGRHGRGAGVGAAEHLAASLAIQPERQAGHTRDSLHSTRPQPPDSADEAHAFLSYDNHP